MADENRNTNRGKAQDQTPQEWQEVIHRVAEQYSLSVPTEQEIGSAEDVEQRLRRGEQEGGE